MQREKTQVTSKERPSTFAQGHHSLGEYSALAYVAGMLPVSALVDVVFHRGITMQRAVERDSENRLNYAMYRQPELNLQNVHRRRSSRSG